MPLVVPSRLLFWQKPGVMWKHPMSPMALSMAALLCQLFLLFIVFFKEE